MAAAAKAVYSEAGVTGLWRGAGPTVQRATLLTASQADRTCEVEAKSQSMNIVVLKAAGSSGTAYKPLLID